MINKQESQKSNSTEDVKQEKLVPAAVVDKVVQSIVTGLGLVTALAWNEAIQETFNKFLSKPAGLAAKFIYALILTTVIVIVTLQLNKFAKKIEKK